MQISSIMTRDKAPAALITALFVIFIVMLPRYTDIAKIWFVLLILSGFGYFLAHLGELRATDRGERFFFAVMLANFTWMAFCFYYNEAPGRGDNYLWGRHFYFLFLIPMFFMFRRIRIPLQLLALGLGISLVISFSDIIIGMLQGIDYRKPGMNMNKFGPIQLCISGLLLCLLPCLDSPLKKSLAGAGVALGLATVLLSQSKATWVAIPVLCTVFIFYLQRNQSPARKLLAIALTLALIAGSYLIPIVQKRVDSLYDNVVEWTQSDHYQDHERKGTFGTRMALWRVAWIIFAQQPLTGAGLGAFEEYIDRYRYKHDMPEYLMKHKYVHNQYLTALATRGIPGLILLLLLLCTPIVIAMRRKANDCETRAACLGLVFLSVTYLVVNIPDDHFEGKSANMFLSVILALLLARISKSGNAETSE